MFQKFSLIALVAPLVSGLLLAIPQNPTSGGQVTIKWTNQQGDPTTWSFELVNTAFNNQFAIANNVDPSENSITITLPVVPVSDGYTLAAVNIGNITDVFASTGDFAVGAGTTSLSSAASTATSKSSSTGSSTGSSVSTTLAATSTSPGFTSVIVPSSTSPAATGSSTTGSGTGTGTAGNAAATTGTSAALSSRLNIARSFEGLAAVVLSAAAGVAMIAL